MPDSVRILVTTTTTVILPKGSILDIQYHEGPPGVFSVTRVHVEFSGTETRLLAPQGTVEVDDGTVVAAQIVYGTAHDMILEFRRSAQPDLVFGQIAEKTSTDDEHGAGVWAGNDEPPLPEDPD